MREVIALMGRLGMAAFVDPITVGIALVAALLLIRFNTNTTWLILGAGALGVVVTVLR